MFLTVNGQDGGGCRVTNLRYLAAPLAQACFTVHTPLMLSFKILMLSLQCRSATRSYLRAGGSLRRRSSLLFVSFLCELLAIVVNFMFRSTIYRLEARSENAMGAQGGLAKFRAFLRRPCRNQIGWNSGTLYLRPASRPFINAQVDEVLGFGTPCCGRRGPRASS